MRRRLTALLRALGILAIIVASVVGGMALALLAAGSEEQQTSIATIRASVRPDFGGHVSVYVPIIDWRVQLLDHRAPASIDLEVLGVDRARAGRGVSSAAAANRTLREVRAETHAIVVDAVRRGAVVAGIGGLAGALVGGAFVAALTRRRRHLAYALPFGAIVTALVLVPSLVVMDGLGDRRVNVSVTGAGAEELPRVLRFAEQLLYVGDEYEGHYRTALRSVANIASFTGRPAAADTSSALVFSDLHDNVFVLDAFRDFAKGSPVFGVGDFVQVGAHVEERTAPEVGKLGSEMVAVSGNHDTAAYMASLRDAGATVLAGRHDTTHVNGLLVAGYRDPLEARAGSDGSHPLRVYGDEYERQWKDFLDWYDGLDERPDIVLVHQHGFAHRLLDHLKEEGDTHRLLILTGHDHTPHVHADGPQVIIDSGTLGAGGLAAVGEQTASFARLNFAAGRVSSVDLITIQPLTGDATSKRTQLG